MQLVKLKQMVTLTTVLMLNLLSSQAMAKVSLPTLFGDSMVLQRERAIPVWGWADAGEKVTVKLGNATASATADDKGNWRVNLPAMPAGGPHEMTVTGSVASEAITIKDVLLGEVWICSGQSNMEWSVSASGNAAEEIAAANYPMIRHIKIERLTAAGPTKDVKATRPVRGLAASWAVCSPQTAGGFTAVGYYFARDLHQKLNVPVGLIGTNWGGTPAESWTSREALLAVPELAAMVEQADTAAKNTAANMEKQIQAVKDYAVASAKAESEGLHYPPLPKFDDPRASQYRPASLYNGMIAGLIPYGIRGAIWYQGEANASRAMQYRTLFPMMIKDWRSRWGQGDFPFYFVQLANFMAVSPQPQESGWAELREAQTMTLSQPNTGMAVIIDIGEAGDIHPKNKQDVGRRLARWALAKDYGFKDLVHSGPLFESMTVEGDKIRIKFKHIGGGLVAKGGVELKGFAIAGEDRKFVWADAKIEGDTVVVSNSSVTNPVAVRYAWANNPICNLYNKAELPASPFRTDDWVAPQPR